MVPSETPKYVLYTIVIMIKKTWMDPEIDQNFSRKTSMIFLKKWLPDIFTQIYDITKSSWQWTSEKSSGPWDRQSQYMPDDHCEKLPHWWNHRPMDSAMYGP